MSGRITIASIVEGYGEVQALPLLVRRIAHETFGVPQVQCLPPHRIRRDQMVTGDVLSRAVRLQAARVRDTGGVLVVADADDDCPVDLRATMQKLIPPVPSSVAVTIAVREFEAWFLAAASSLTAHSSVQSDADYPDDPDCPRDAKGALSQLMREKYRETLHQPAFAALIDLHLAQRSRSFKHLTASVGKLLRQGRCLTNW